MTNGLAGDDWCSIWAVQYGTYFPLKKLATKCFGVFFEVLSPHTSPLFCLFLQHDTWPFMYWLLLYRSPTGTVSPSSKARGRGKGGDTELLVENTSSGGKVAMKFCSFPMKTREKLPLHILYVYIYKIHCVIYIHIQIHIHMIQCPAAPPPPYVGHFEQEIHFILGKDWLCSSKKRIRFWGNPSPTLRNSVTDFGENQPATLGKWATDFGKKSFGGSSSSPWSSNPIVANVTRCFVGVANVFITVSQNNSYVTTMSWMRQSYPGEVESVGRVGWRVRSLWQVNPFY